MIEKRKTYEIKQGNGDILHKVVMETPPCDLHSEKSKYIQMWMFHSLHTYPDLFQCGPLSFETFNIKHDGGKWVITLTAIEKRNET